MVPSTSERSIEFANNPEDPDRVGWALTAAFGLVFLGLAISSGSYYHMNYRFVTSTRGSLVSLIYAKTMDLSITALDESVAVTLMSNDTGKLRGDSCRARTAQLTLTIRSRMPGIPESP